MTKRKRIPQHLEWAIEDISQEIADIVRYNSEADDALHDARGVNKYLLMALSSKIAASVARIEKSLDAIERREGPPANGASESEIDYGWVNMLYQLIEMDTPTDAIKLIIAKKIEELS